MLVRILRRKVAGPAKRQAQPLFPRLSDADLADMGIKRYQLENLTSS